ncbi:MAG: VIT and VWA domain-containing protein [Deltaproteobacteria bacterium]|nr:VIT and VWA domain-containing protein [Deltaproteobacteria bacterium]
MAQSAFFDVVTAPVRTLDADEELWIIVPRRPADADPTPAEPGQPGSGALVATRPSGDKHEAEVPLPLKHTEVHAAITGYVGTVDVTQQFANPFDEKIEAVYMFPLPEKAAVSEFVMTIGERRIRGILREKEEAEAIYREARAQGYQASLLTQHRPNIFEQKVANIEPGKRIDVNIRYFHSLAYRDGWYTFVLPTVVGPRYNPPGSKDPVHALPRSHVQPVSTGAGVRYLRPEERSGHDIGITVKLDAGVAIEAMESNHRIDQTRAAPHAATIKLADQATIPNRDFVLKFKVAGGRVKTNLLTYVDPKKGQGYFTMVLYPPEDLDSAPRHPMEMVFVLDCSGSMRGEPIAQAKAAILAALDMLKPGDTFQVIRFSNNASQFGPNPVPATPENVARAKRYVRQLDGSGGTEMIEGIRAALNFPHDPRRLRFVTFLTDGYIGNEAEILDAIHKSIRESRIFSFGVGDSVNRYLLNRMAKVGRGAAAYLALDDAGAEVMRYFFNRISRPVLSDVEIDWGTMKVTDTYPKRLPDVFVGRAVVVTGKFTGEPSKPVVRGRAGGQRVEYMVSQADGENAHAFIPNIWARLRLADLADRQAWTHDPHNELAGAIKKTALEYGLMSDYTAFVAVDASGRTEGKHGTTVHQAVPVPRGVRYTTTVKEERTVKEGR